MVNEKKEKIRKNLKQIFMDEIVKEYSYYFGGILTKLPNLSFGVCFHGNKQQQTQQRQMFVPNKKEW